MVEHIHKAAKVKNDEYYTLYDDVEYGLRKYDECFRGKTVYCPADDYHFSNFTLYFKKNFSRLGLKKLICTNFAPRSLFWPGEPQLPWRYEFDGNTEHVEELLGDGDFASAECRAIMAGCDVVVTNPPFSLFNKLVKQIDELGKDFILLGTVMKINITGVFPMFWEGRCSSTCPKNPTMSFNDGQKVSNCIWYSTMEVADPGRRPLPKIVKFNDKQFQTYDQHPEVIVVDKINDLPYDHDGLMAVPLTVLYYDWRSEYSLVGLCFGKRSGNKPRCNELIINDDVAGRAKFVRLLIQKKSAEKNPRFT